MNVRRNRMIEFPFEVNKSFINVPWHPITILKICHPILKRHIRTSHHPINLYTLNNVLDAYIYYGGAGYGPYYQIRTSSNERNTIRQDYRLGQLLKVKIIFKESIKVYLENGVSELKI